MKTFITTATLIAGLAISGIAMAGGNDADATSEATAGALNKGNNQNITFEGAEATDIPKQAPAIAAPALTTTMTETCMGSTSFGGSGAGFGLTLGSTWRDDECVRRLNARQIASMGYPVVGKELMCDNDEVRAAFERVAKMTSNADFLCQSSADENTAANDGLINTAVYVEPLNSDRNPQAIAKRDETPSYSTGGSVRDDDFAYGGRDIADGP